MKNILMLFCFFIVSSDISAQNLSISISLEKKVYVKGEPVTVLITKQNMGREPIEMSFVISSNQYEFIINNYSGKSAFIADESSPIAYYRILPSEEITILRGLNSEYGNDNDELPFGKIFRTGEYTVRLRYRDLFITGRDTIRNNLIESNEVRFTVVNPGEEEMLIRNKLIALYNSRGDIGLDNYTKMLYELFYSSLNSPYVSVIAVQFLEFSSSNTQGRRKLLLDFPNNYWAAGYRSVLLDYDLKQEQDYETKYKGSLLEKELNSLKIFKRDRDKHKGLFQLNSEK